MSSSHQLIDSNCWIFYEQHYKYQKVDKVEKVGTLYGTDFVFILNNFIIYKSLTWKI